MGRYTLRERLWHKDRRCHWCGRLTRLIVPGNHEKLPDDMATVDHLYSRLDENRHNLKRGIIRKDKSGNIVLVRRVLACYSCNQRRGRVECKLTKALEHRISTANGLPRYSARHKQLHECDCKERRYRLRRLKEMAERNIAGLIRVMGLPLHESTIEENNALS
jgi:hypothetical protein